METTRQLFAATTVRSPLAEVEPLPSNGTTTTKLNLLADAYPPSTLSTTEILLIAFGTGILITTIVVLGVLAVCKWRRKGTTIGMSANNRSKANNGHDRILNGGLRQPLFGSRKYVRPEIVITEATSDVERRSSGPGSIKEIQPAKSVTHVPPPPPPCSLAIAEDLEESELMSPAVMENNIGTLNNPTVNSHYTRAGLTNSGRSGGMSIPTNKSIDRDDIVVYSEADPETDRSFRLNRTQSISSTSSDKMERPSYSYSNQSPHGMQPYGIGEPLLNGEQDLGPSSYAHASQINTLLATTVEVGQMS